MAFSFVKTARRNATTAPAYGHARRRGPSVARRKRSAARKTRSAARSSALPTIPVTASTWIGATAKSAAAASEGARGMPSERSHAAKRSVVPACRATLTTWKGSGAFPVVQRWTA